MALSYFDSLFEGMGKPKRAKSASRDTAPLQVPLNPDGTCNLPYHRMEASSGAFCGQGGKRPAGNRPTLNPFDPATRKACLKDKATAIACRQKKPTTFAQFICCVDRLKSQYHPVFVVAQSVLSAKQQASTLKYDSQVRDLTSYFVNAAGAAGAPEYSLGVPGFVKAVTAAQAILSEQGTIDSALRLNALIDGWVSAANPDPLIKLTPDEKALGYLQVYTWQIGPACGKEDPYATVPPKKCALPTQVLTKSGDTFSYRSEVRDAGAEATIWKALPNGKNVILKANPRIWSKVVYDGQDAWRDYNGIIITVNGDKYTDDTSSGGAASRMRGLGANMARSGYTSTDAFTYLFGGLGKETRLAAAACRKTGGRYVYGKKTCVPLKKISYLPIEPVRGRVVPIDITGRPCPTGSMWDSGAGGVWQQHIDKRNNRCVVEFSIAPDSGGGGGGD